MKEKTELWCFRCQKKPEPECTGCKYFTECEYVPTGELEVEDGDIVLEKHTGGDRVCFDGNEYTLAESRDVIQILPLDDQDDIRTYYKPYWKVVKQ